MKDSGNLLRIVLTFLFTSAPFLIDSVLGATNGGSTWTSPNHLMRAQAITSKQPGRPDLSWDVVSVLSKHQTSLASLSLEKGTGVGQARVGDAVWSPDSRFFVFTTFSSGGHSPWHMPTYVFDAKTSLIYSIDDTLGVVASSNRKLRFISNDTIQLEFYYFDYIKDAAPHSVLKSVNLLDLAKKGAKVAAHSLGS